MIKYSDEYNDGLRKGYEQGYKHGYENAIDDRKKITEKRKAEIVWKIQEKYGWNDEDTGELLISAFNIKPIVEYILESMQKYDLS